MIGAGEGDPMCVMVECDPAACAPMIAAFGEPIVEVVEVVR